MDLSPDEDNFQGRLLHQAALWDNVELLQELLASGADVNARDSNQRSALHAAALGERSRCLAALCAAGADLDAKCDAPTGGKTALHIAAERGHVENVKTLLASGADLSVTDAGGYTALALAERQRHRHAALTLREARDALEKERLSQHAQLRELVTRGETHQLRQKLAALGEAAGLIVNLTPGGANTLLYIASEAGVTSAVAALLEAGADGRAHPVTKYCPLYIAACHGRKDIAALLLQHFPQAVQQETVEKWLPIHAACIGGHASLVTMLLEFPYPESLLNTYTDVTGQWEYRAAFDVNAVDVSGQSALHIACTLGNLPVVEALLAYSVPAHPVPAHTPTTPPVAPPVTTPARAGISLGIHAIVNKLTGTNRNEPTETEHRIRPVRLDATRNGDSCVSCATRGGHYRVVAKLLAAGANADSPALPPNLHQIGGESSLKRRSRSASAGGRHHSPSPGPRDLRDGPWTALALAVYYKNTAIAELLLGHGATDPHCRALRECATHGLAHLLPHILATKAYPDPDYKVNRSTVSQRVLSSRDTDAALTYSSLCPTVPVMVTWRELKSHLAHIRMSWLRAAAIRVNSKLSSSAEALHALTRIDVSNNELRLLPPELFTLLSLRYLNAAQNKLERLPSLSEPFEDELDSKGRKVKRNSKKARPEVYSAPVLQELYLQDNRLEELPPELFSLPALQTLDVSNNKLRALPAAVWAAPALRDLSAKLNLLRDLPAPHKGEDSNSPSRVMSPSSSSSQVNGSPSSGSGQFTFSQYKSVSRSPSIECSESDTQDDDDGIPTLGNRAGNAVWCEARRVHTWRGVVEAPVSLPAARCPIQALNLAHNQFTCVPPVLACVAPALTRLSMAYNNLRSMSYVTSYPTGLRQLDLSHNEITCWPSLPQIDNFSTTEGDPLACYCPESRGSRGRPRSGSSVRSALLSAACPARRHLRLDSLRTLILANNLLTRIQLTTDDDGFASQPHDGSVTDDDDEWNCGSALKSRLLFPMLSMLDVSCNLLRSVPPQIHELTSLAVLNISGNKDITDLPPQMGLLSRLWNLNTVGCSLNEPLKSMVESGRYKSMDIIGYLLSVHREAKPYTRCKLMFVGLQGIGKTSLLECLRQESSIQYRRKPTDHWARRMGNKGTKRNMSTVGVDIGTWTYEKHRSSRGPVTFRTWDFGGQHEYYATHQYFLSRRSIYLVVWKVTDGRKGLAGALDWLRSIQARAPGSPVIMVATHYDQVANSNLPESESPEALQRLIRSTIMAAPDADKLGLPRVLDSVEVSCSTRHNIRLLADIIYSVAFSVKPPGSKEPLLEQRIPATYLALEECVTALAAELKEPVLKHDEYKRLVTQYMQQKNHRMFRDAAELHQATMFLHENGVLLHYDDATLKELYFLRPQWLCDVLAHVVTVREINPFAHNGIMKIEDLAHVFKASPLLAGGEDASALGVSLLNKFELALCWDNRVLLVPPLLPAQEPVKPQLAVRSRPWTSASRGTPRRAWPAAASLATFADGSRGTDSPTLVQEAIGGITISGRNGGFALRRLVLLSYVPRGFWARLVTRVLADTSVPPTLYRLPPEVENDESVSKALELSWGWKVWRCGVTLSCGGVTVAALRELPPNCDPILGIVDYGEHPYGHLRLRVKQEGAWCELEVQSSACVEILLPAQVCVVRREDGLPIAGYQSLSLEPNPETLTKLLALLSDHVDLLLEDWYPSLGTRFVHTSEGRCLMTRVAPCPACLRDAQNDNNTDTPTHNGDHLAQAFKRLELGGTELKRLRLSEESRASDGDSGVGAESNASSRLGSVEGVAPPVTSSVCRVAHAWTVEECILAACTSAPLRCPAHPHDVGLRELAPDTLLLDVEESKRARWDQITITGVAGRGAFGTVLCAAWRRGTQPAPRIALKALQPVPPPHHADAAAHQAYKAAASRWQREPVSAACRAYCALRQELAVLSRLSHAHVLPLNGVCPAPLALLLTLAPMGSLEGMLREYRGCGVRVGVRTARALALQAARALEYLHSNRVVYRDLKSENVLVWTMPRPQEAAAAEASAAALDVHVKLGDYGISRLAPPSGTKGFGGTEGFMAPEMMRYNGEEEYNEKVDCFSFGMLLYEIVTLRQPFEGHEAVKEAVLDGARPSLSPKDLQYPCCILETMRRCWQSAPSGRPSAAALVSILAAPELPAMQDAVALRHTTTAAAAPILNVTEESGGWEVWCGGEAERALSLLCTPHAFTHQHSTRIPPDKGEAVTVTAMCRVGAKMWLGDSAGRVTVYNISTCAISWTVAVPEAVCATRCAVSALLALNGGRVALALHSGRLFLVSSRKPEAEGSFILTELGAATELSCLAAVPTPSGVELWAGGDGLYCYTINAEGVCAAETLALASDGQDSGTDSGQDVGQSGLSGQKRVTLLAAPEDEPYVIVYYEPGVCVYQWSVRSRRPVARLDVSKLAPCSESLQSIAIDDRLARDNCRVTALCLCRGVVYMGTMWGCIVVADGSSLRPLTVFRPYTSDVRAIIPLPQHKSAEGGPMLATLGAGYRPLTQRYAPQQSNSSTNQQYTGDHCLLWRASRWLPD